MRSLRQTISLDGDTWERRDFLDEAWRWSDALRRTDEAAAGGPPAQAGVSGGWRAAGVPGSAIDDAWCGGEVPNPYLDRNSLAAEWVPERTWLYRRRFTVPDDAPPRAVLRFGGIDPGGSIFVDGREVGRHAGMFVPFEVELPDVRPGAHDLVVVLDSAPWMPSQVGRTELARHHRSRMGYGWDFCPRMVHTGIWRPVSLDLFEARLARRHLAVSVDAGLRRARVTVAADVGGDARGATLVARAVDPGGVTVAEERVPVTNGGVEVVLEVADPVLWWPNGLGAASLYRLEMRLEAETLLDERTARFGVRSLEMAPNAGAPADARPYTVVVNGRPSWIRGWNWVPLDACHGVPRPERLRHLVELARRANVNLLRVWGGGLIESQDFYEACDEAGILVWQEFIQSSSGVSNAPADDDEFVDLMRREAESIVPALAGHPSLAIWCGGNELSDADGRPLDDGHPVLAALREVVERLDPARPWLPTSPSGARFANTLEVIAEDPESLHDVHGPWEHQGLADQHALANATTSLLHSEFGVESMTNLATLEATVSAEHRLPADRSNPFMAHRGAWWNNEPFVQRAFGGDLRLDDLERASQHLQADGLRTAIEGDRRRWPRNSGAIVWQLNESFPNAWCTSAVDYFGVPKAAYHAVAEAYSPVAIGLVLASQVLDGADRLIVRPWIANDTDATVDGPMRITLHDATGRVLADEEVALVAGPNAVTELRDLELGVPPDAADLLVLTASTDSVTSRRLLSRTSTLEPLRRLEPAALDWTIAAPDGECWMIELAVRGHVAAAEIRLADARAVGWPERAGAAYFDANLLTVLPGEERRVCVEWRGVPGTERAVMLSAWNVPAGVITA